MSHKFKVGQRVRRLPNAFADKRMSAGGDISEVVRLMPADHTGEVSYRIRSGFAERAVREDEIDAVA